jgi:FemAB-related protein (PEP-CTERM system-associated)
VIEASQGHRTIYLEARNGQEIAGVLPLVEMKSRLFGHFFISVPYVSYGGVLARSAAARDALLVAARAFAREAGASYVELRQSAAIPTDWLASSAKMTMVVRTAGHTHRSLLSGFSSRLRNKINHARKHGFAVRWGGDELLDDFYEVFARNMRDLGVPVHSKKWFDAVLRHGPSGSCLLCIYEDGACVAGTLITRFRDAMELPWIASTAAARKHYSTVLLYWTALEYAVEQGIAAVDLGRCRPGTGTHRFKLQWNPEEVSLPWYYALPQGSTIPPARHAGAMSRLAMAAWKRLPLIVANHMGPHIVRNIP